MKENKILRSIYRLSGICQSYSILHYRVSIISYYVDLVLGLLTGSITTATGVLLSQENKECDSSMMNQNNVKIPLLFTSAILTFCQQFLGLSKISSDHLYSYKKYQKMYNDIVCFTSNNFYTPKQEEEMDKSKKFLIKINEEINVLIMKSPPIDPTIALFFHKKFKDHKIKLPELNGIETNRNSPSGSTSETASDKDETVIELTDYHLM